MTPPKFMPYVCKYFSLMMYWLENVIFILMFVVVELLLVIPVYIKNLLQIAWASIGLFTTALNVAIWVFGGIPLTIFIALRDVFNLVNILRMHEGCRTFQGMTDELA